MVFITTRSDMILDLELRRTTLLVKAVPVYAYLCIQLLYIIQLKTVLIILWTVTVLSTRGKIKAR